MNTQEYINKRILECSQYIPTEEDLKIIKFEGIQEYIFRKLKSKKFRKTSLEEVTTQRIKNAIKINVENNNPIKIVYPFGGYKVKSIPSYPFVDYAELFMLTYVVEYISSILPVYKPGVKLIFSSDDICVEQIDNFPRKDLNAYLESFKELIKTINSHAPTNLKIELVKVFPDIYPNIDEYKKELEIEFNKRKALGLDEKQSQRLENKMKLHFNIKGEIDYSKLSKEELDNTILDLYYYGDAYLNIPTRSKYLWQEENILIFSNKIPGVIDIGSTQASKTKFGTGIGVLEIIDEKYTEKILSPKQWKSSREVAKVQNIKLEDLSLKTLNDIPIFKEKLDFLNND